MPTPKKRSLPLIGSVFSREYKGRKYSLAVVSDEKGGIEYKVGRAVYESPSAAAKSLVGNEVNGWTWWKIEPR